MISTLPMLHFRMRPPFSFERFLDICSYLIPAEDIDVLKNCLEINGDCREKINPTLSRWREFDRSLRNELVKLRAARKRGGSLRYIRGDGYADPSVAHVAVHAYRTHSLLEAEEILDRARWEFLEGLAVGHHFDIDFLIAYACKLLILERWGRIEASDKVRELERTLASASGKGPATTGHFVS
ncbi:MAG: DUF2764 family protein [Candidatus Omnitrophica bacterium]|nr:DUF2764 family protein [Candidatus Omnitrophota bacterium]